MPVFIDPLIRNNGSFSNTRGATKRTIVSNMNEGYKNPHHYVDGTAISDGVTDARAAIAAADADGPIVLPPGTYAIASSLAIANSVKLDPGAKLKPANTVVITLNGGYTAEDTQYVFDISAGGSIVVNKQDYITPQHFGADGSNDTSPFRAAVATAIDKCELFIPSGPIGLGDLATPVSITGDLTIKGNGEVSVITGPDLVVHLFEVASTSGAKIDCSGIKFSTFYLAFNLQGNAGQDDYKVSITDCYCDNFGRGVIGSGGGVYWDAISVNISNNHLTNMGLSLSDVEANAIELAVDVCPSIHVTNNEITNVGSLSNTQSVWGILVDRSPATDKQQSVVVSGNTVKNVLSGVVTAGTEQVCGIMVLAASAIITSNIVDTVQAPNHNSNPEGIYSKCPKSIISNNKVIDVYAKEGAINLKGELDASTAGGSVVSGNYIGFRTPGISGASVGIGISAQNVTVENNILEGMNLGIITTYDDTLIRDNVLKGVITTGVEVQVGENGIDTLIYDNVFRDFGYQISVTLDHTTETFTANAHGRANGDTVVLTGTLPVELALDTIYTLRDVTTNTFKVAIGGGAAIAFSSNGTNVKIQPAYGYGVLFTVSGTQTMGTLDISDNTLKGFLNYYSYAVRGFQTSSGAIDRLIVNGNYIHGFDVAVPITTNGTEQITKVEFCNNHMYSTPTGYSSNAVTSLITQFGNFVDGVPSVDNGDRKVHDTGSLGTGTRTFSFNDSNGYSKKVTATGAISLAFSATVPGYYTAIVVMDGTGGRLITYATTVVGKAPIINTAGSGKTLIPLFYDGSTWFHVSQQENATAATAQLDSLTSIINTEGKYEGKQAFNTDTNKPVYALGSAANAQWVDATGTIAHTPV